MRPTDLQLWAFFGVWTVIGVYLIFKEIVGQSHSLLDKRRQNRNGDRGPYG
jgi:hypothetical protein